MGNQVKVKLSKAQSTVLKGILEHETMPARAFLPSTVGTLVTEELITVRGGNCSPTAKGEQASREGFYLRNLDWSDQVWSDHLEFVFLG